MKKLSLLFCIFCSVMAFSQTPKNVGIGTNAPGSNLSIKGNLGVGTNYSTTTPSGNPDGAIIEGKVGVGTSSPVTALDVNGAISTREGQPMVLVNGGSQNSGTGTNDNIVLPDVVGTSGVKAGFYRITGPTAAFSIFGIAPVSGADGQQVTLVNTTGFAMTIKNNASFNSQNSILTLTGNDLNTPASNSSITLQYNKTSGRWYVTATQNFFVSASSIATKDIVPGTGSAVTVTNGAGQVVGGGNVVLDVATNALNQKGIVPGPTGVNGYQSWVTDVNGNPAWGKVNNNMLNSSSITITPGTGMSGGGSVALGGTVTVTNSAPDQTVVLNNGTGISVSGSYPNFTITNTAPSSGGTVTGSGTQNYVTKWNNAGGTTLGNSTIYDNGNVGVGNTSPQDILSVGAATSDAQNVTVRSYSNSPASWKGGGAFGYTSASVIMGELNGVAQIGGHNGTISAWANLALNSAGGNVGIGTTTPQEKLDVNGNIELGYNQANSIQVYKGFGTSHSASNVPYSVSFGAVDGSTIMGIAVNGVRNGANTFNDQYITFSTHQGGISAGERMRITQAGSVGIGTTSPATTLDVNGVTNSATGYRVANAATSGNYLRGNGTNFVSSAIQPSDIPAGNGNYIQNQTSLQASSNFNISGNGYIGGNVGVGTTSPAAALQLYQDRYVIFGPNSGWASNLRVGGNGGVVDGYASIATTNGNLHMDASSVGPGNAMYLNYYKGAGGIYFGTGATSAHSFFSAAGFLGVGNTSPQHQLSVGAATSDGQTVTVRGYSNSPASWKGGAAFGYTSASVIMGELSGVATIGGHNATLGAWGNLAINSGGGNVGIGTSTPANKLQVSAGDASLALFGPNATWGAYLYVGAAGNQVASGRAQVISTNGNLHLDAGVGENIYIANYNASNTFINPQGGNVGVGTTSPTTTLDVAGNIMGGNTAQRWTAARTGYVQSASWTTIPGLTITFTLTHSATVEILANGTQRAPTAGTSSQCHEAYRMTLDGVAQGDATHGERINTSNGLTQWWAIWNYASSVSLAAGSHTISIDTHESAGYSPQCVICGEVGGSLTGYTNCNLVITAVNKYP